MTLPPTDYGYWIDPDGTFHVVDRVTKHVGFAGGILGRAPGGEGPLNDDHRYDLLERGWTRVAVHSGHCVIQLPPCSLKPEVIDGLDQLIRRHHQQAMVPIHVQDPLTGLDAGGKTVRSGDPAVLRQWRRIVRRRGVQTVGPNTPATHGREPR